MNLNIDFMRFRHITTGLSIFLLVTSLVAFFWVGVNRGLDFTGGVLVELGFNDAVDPVSVRSLMELNGYPNTIVQALGSEREIQIRVPANPDINQADAGDEIRSLLTESFGDVDLRRSEFVGPTIGEELTEKGGIAMLVALAMVLLYIMFRFTSKFAVGAVLALFHDIVIVVGFFCVFGWTFNQSELAAILAVIGYSLNDTIVVSDRIRENFRAVRVGKSIDIINRSLNQTFGRTLVTSITTLLVLVALLIAGGPISGFATGLTIGVIVGTYSSIYVAANSLLWLNISTQDLALPKKEGVDTGV